LVTSFASIVIFAAIVMAVVTVNAGHKLRD
jgi:hypothetical protein